MIDFMANVKCPACEKVTRMELRKMRLDFHVHWPWCGTEYTVSEAQAGRAHRLLDTLEHTMNRIAGHHAGMARSAA